MPSRAETVASAAAATPAAAPRAGTTAAELAAMQAALAAARHVDLQRDPNPRVGAVVLSSTGEVLGSGVHRGAGTPHAEVVALDAARADGHDLGGATVVVTLEPCAHQGRTGPCTRALLDAGIRRLLYGQPDPNPQAAGGAQALRDAGIEVVGGVLADKAEALNPRWTFAMRHRRPFVTWKVGCTLDGRSAASDGTSQWITGPQARADVQRLRAACDTVLVGTGTAIADDPALTLRDAAGDPVPRDQQPLRVVMGTRRPPSSLRMFDAQAESLRLPTRDPAWALEELFRGQERRHVLLEGGPTIAAAFCRAGLVDTVVAYVAPMLLGSGLSCVGDLGVGTLGDALRLRVVDVTSVGADVRLVLRPDQPDEEARAC